MKVWRFDVNRSGVSVVALAVLAIFLMATTLSEVEKRRTADAARDRAIAQLTVTNQGIVGKLSEVFAKAAAAEEAARAAGQVPTQTLGAVVASLKGYVDPSLIALAIRRAGLSARGPAGPPGPPGAATPPPASSTSTTASSTATTAPPVMAVPHDDPPPASSTTTTTARSCTVTLLGLCVLR